MYKFLRKFLNDYSRIYRILLFIIYDILVIGLSEYLSLLVRFEFSFSSILPVYLNMALKYTPINIILTITVFAIFQLYTSLWRYASVQELFNLSFSCVITSGLQILITLWLGYRMPRSYYVLYTFFLLCFMIVGRFSYRALRVWKRTYYVKRQKDPVRTMVIGAGDAGRKIIQEIQTSYLLNYDVVCVIDEKQGKIGSRILNIPIVGGNEVVLSAVEKYGVEEIIIAIPTLSGQKRKDLLEICKESGCKLQILPELYQLINEEVSISQLKEVQIEDLLGREQVKENLNIIMEYVCDRTVLVTGGGGSIGSELCRQIAAHKPKRLIIFDIYENSVYDLQQELNQRFQELDLIVLIGSVRNTHRVESIFEKYKPNLVYHAAAHKHVPLMEDSPNEAIKNNVFGTWNAAKAAEKYGADKFVLISTDKAVNPTNIMGASKRLCEMVIQGMSRNSKHTEFAAVRFGNVLGSNGSVIPLFKKQIEAGGPVTVTDKNIIRYFMTIPEAVSLVLQAGAFAKGGEIFILDMGDPVKIDDLARNLIKLSGYRPDEDIKIEYTGLRPGEKLYEELLVAEEGLQKTENDLIFIGKPLEFDEEEFFEKLAELKVNVYEDREDIKSVIKQLVPTYRFKE